MSGRSGTGMAGATLIALALLAGCETVPQPGQSGRAAEIERVRANRDFSIVSVTPARIDLVARGQAIRLEPLPGLCLSGDALDLTASGVFAVVADCAAGDAAPGPSFPGLITMSVGAEPLFEDGLPEVVALRRIRDFVGTVPGLAMLARNGDPQGVRLVGTRRIGGALYAHVEEAEADDTVFARQFWRAFVEIEDRLVLVTVLPLADAALPSGGVLSALAAQVAQLRRSNGLPAVGEEDSLAVRREAGAEDAVASVTAQDAVRRAAPPTPLRRATRGGGSNAPRTAPEAPLRPADRG